jgi:zinc transporter ZupT
LVLVVTRGGALRWLASGAPAVEELAFERVKLRPGKIEATVVNGGPSPVTVAQVMVDEAYWAHTMRPGRTVPRLGRATIVIPYEWVVGEPVALTLLTATGLTFTHEVAVAVATPEPGLRYFGVFGLIGLYVGVIPVAIGLLWYPFLRSLSRRWTHFALALTGGLLLFLAVDSLEEALASASRVAGSLQGVPLVVLGVILTVLLLEGLGGSRRVASEGPAARRSVAFLVALGIGLHNLGEGLAIGAAYAVGEATLGAFLVIGFMLHNVTEGLGIVAPVARDRPSLGTLAALGAIAGLPTVLGSWVGGVAFSPVLATLAFSVGAGAILQVVGVLYRVVRREVDGPLWQPLNAAGVMGGMLLMYGTGLAIRRSRWGRISSRRPS